MTVATRAGGDSSGGRDTAGGRRPLPPAKPREIEDLLNRRLFHPLSRRLAAALAHTFVTPNMVSLTGAVLVVAAGVFYSFFGGAWAVALGFACHMLWHVVDGADGDLARLTGRASPLGEMVDGACDYLSHALIYLFLSIHLAGSLGLSAYALGLAAGVLRVAQSNHAESQRRTYLWRAYGVPWIKHARDGGHALFRRDTILTRLTRAYVWLADLLIPTAPALDAAAREAAHDPALRRRLTRLCRRASRRPLLVQSLLGANPRTVLLGLSMALGSPLYFFIVETTAMSLLLLVSIRWQKASDAAIIARLGYGANTAGPATPS